MTSGSNSSDHRRPESSPNYLNSSNSMINYHNNNNNNNNNFNNNVINNQNNSNNNNNRGREGRDIPRAGSISSERFVYTPNNENKKKIENSIFDGKKMLNRSHDSYNIDFLDNNIDNNSGKNNNNDNKNHNNNNNNNNFIDYRKRECYTAPTLETNRPSTGRVSTVRNAMNYVRSSQDLVSTARSTQPSPRVDFLSSSFFVNDDESPVTSNSIRINSAGHKSILLTGNDMIVNEMDKVIDLIQEDDGDKMSDDRYFNLFSCMFFY